MAKPKAPKKVSKPGKKPVAPKYPKVSQKKFSSRLYYLEDIYHGRVKGKKITPAQARERTTLLQKFHKTKPYQAYAKQNLSYKNYTTKYNAQVKAYSSYQAAYNKYTKALTSYNNAMRSVSGRLGGLSGANKDSAAALTNLFKQYGLDTLAPKIIDFVKRGYGPDTVTVLLQETKEYKTRFAGNEARRKKGMAVLSPAEYLATESAYRQIMSQAGMPVGFYDKPADFNKWIGGDVSPTEIQERVKAANDMIRVNGSWVKTTLRDYYGQDVDDADLAAYALDPKRALPIIQERLTTAQIGGGAAQFGLRGQVSKERAEQLRSLGVTGEEAQQGYGAIAGILPEAAHLAAIYGQKYDIRTAEQEVLLGDARAAEKRKRLASQERATFSASSGVASGGLSGPAGQT